MTAGLEIPGDEGSMTRSLTRAVVCSIAICLIPLVAPLFLGRVFVIDDLFSFQLPIRYVYQQLLQSGTSLFWTPDLASGFYLHGEGQAGMMHPWHLVLYRWLPLGPAFNIEIIANYLAALVGMSAFLRRLELSRPAAWFGAIFFAFSGFNVMHLPHVNGVAIIAHLPWILLAAHHLLTTESRAARSTTFCGVALLLASQLLLGYPQYVWMTVLAVGYLTGCLLWTPHAKTRVPLLAGALALGALIGGIQVLPTLDAMRHSVRAVTSGDFRLSWSLHPANLLQLISPFLFRYRIFAAPEEFRPHEFSPYNGAFCTIAIVWLVVRWRDLAQRRLAVAFLVAAGLSLLFALGRYGVIYTWLSELPGVSSFRASARHLVLFHLSLAGIAGIAFQDLASVAAQKKLVDWRRLWPLAIPVVGALIVTTGGAILAGSVWARGHQLQFSGLPRAMVWPVMLSTIVAGVVFVGRGVRFALPAVALVSVFDLGLWGFLYVYQARPMTIEAIRALAAGPVEGKPGDLILPSGRKAPVDLYVMNGFKIASVYAGLPPATELNLDDAIAQRIAGVAWLEAPQGWVKVPAPMPRGRVVGDAELAANVREQIHAIDISRVALVDGLVPKLGGGHGHVTVVSDKPGALTFETRTESPQLLVATERFHEGWTVSEDGVPARALRVYGDYLGAQISAGSHRVEFTFRPQSARTGSRLAIVGLALTIGLALGMAYVPIRTRAGSSVAGIKAASVL